MQRLKVVLVFLIALSIFYGSPALGKAQFGEEDIKRILYYPRGNSVAQSNFLVLDSVTLSGALKCHILGTNRSLTVSPRQVQMMKFFEDSSNFLISQYALYNVLRGDKKNLPLQLMRQTGDANNRLQLITKSIDMLKKIEKQVKRINAPDTDEKIRLFFAILNNAGIDSQLKQAIADRDWILALVLLESIQAEVKSLALKISTRQALINDIEKSFTPCQTALLNAFTAQQNIANVRRKNFSQIFPLARGAWSNPVPTNYNALKKLFAASMRSFFQLDNISKIFNPQDWGSAMLNILMMVEGTPAAATLEKEFDDALRQFVNKK